MFNADIREILRTEERDPKTVLSGINFSLLPGFIYTITGRNGSGKTTLLKSLTLLNDKRIFTIKGEIFFNGISLLDLDEEKLAVLRQNQIKYVFQDPVSSFNPLKKLDYYFRIFYRGKEEIDDLLDYLQLPGRKVLREMHSYELSGGMCQRLAIALAVSVKPSLLFLDEPNSGIDNSTTQLLKKLLKNFVRENQSAVLLTTQDISFAEEMTDYIGFLEKGTFTGFMGKDEFFRGNPANEEIRSFLDAYRSI